MGNKSSSNKSSSCCYNYNFIYYVRWGHTDEVKRYLQHNGIGDNFEEALRVACEYNRLEIAKMLINLRIDFKNDSEYLIQITSRYGYLNICNLLINNGVKVKNNNSMWLANKYGQRDVIRLLVSHGGDPLYISPKNRRIMNTEDRTTFLLGTLSSKCALQSSISRSFIKSELCETHLLEVILEFARSY
jgi:hypothetical protein